MSFYNVRAALIAAWLGILGRVVLGVVGSSVGDAAELKWICIVETALDAVSLHDLDIISGI